MATRGMIKFLFLGRRRNDPGYTQVSGRLYLYGIVVVAWISLAATSYAGTDLIQNP